MFLNVDIYIYIYILFLQIDLDKLDVCAEFLILCDMATEEYTE